MDTAEGLIECKARGRFRKTVGKPIVGDRVTLEIQPEDGTGYLQTIAPRKNSLTGRLWRIWIWSLPWRARHRR